jgi:hypothetical protein
MSESDNVLVFRRMPEAKDRSAGIATQQLNITLELEPDGTVGVVHMFAIKDTAKNRHIIAARLEEAAAILRVEGEQLAPEPDQRWVITLTFFASGRVMSRWRNGRFNTLRDLRWLKRRFLQDYRDKRHEVLVGIAFSLGERIRHWWRGK